MTPLDAFWHLFNLFAPALGMGLLAPALAKLFWRKTLRRVSYMRMALTCGGICALCLAAGLLALGRDGKMVTYGALVLASAASLGWFVYAAGRASAR